MRIRITWFIIGFIVSWLTVSTIAYVRSRPQDITRERPKELSAAVLEMTPWYKTAKGVRAGNFVIWTPRNSLIGAALIFPTELKFPSVLVNDSDSNGVCDDVYIADSKLRGIYLDDKDGDGVFDSLQYTTGPRTTDFSFSDSNMDGVYDMRISSETGTAINIDGNWYNLIRKDGKQYVDIDGKTKGVQCVDRVWRLRGLE